jgi:hypothetical protein
MDVCVRTIVVREVVVVIHGDGWWGCVSLCLSSAGSGSGRGRFRMQTTQKNGGDWQTAERRCVARAFEPEGGLFKGA